MKPGVKVQFQCLREAEKFSLLWRDYLNGAASVLDFFPTERTDTFCTSDAIALRSDFVKIASDFSTVWKAYLKGLEALEGPRDDKREQQERRKQEGVTSD